MREGESLIRESSSTQASRAYCSHLNPMTPLERIRTVLSQSQTKRPVAERPSPQQVERQGLLCHQSQ
jgi:hypothetical protein